MIHRNLTDALVAATSTRTARAGGAVATPDTSSWTVLHSFDIADHRRQLAKQHAEFDGIPFWSAVCFPFIDFTETLPE